MSSKSNYLNLNLNRSKSNSSDSYSDSFNSRSSSESGKKSSRRSSSDSRKSYNNEKKPKSLEKYDSSSQESLASALSGTSRANSIKILEEEYSPIGSNLPYNVYQTLFSIKDSMINIYNLESNFQENLFKITDSSQESQEIKEKNEKLADLMVKELIGVISLNQVIYGQSHWKLAWSHIHLAQIYLEYKNLPKQAKHHCEQAWSIFLEDLKDETCFNLNNTNESNTYEYYNQDLNKHQMILNYIYGKSCTILKQNEKGEEALEMALEYYENWKSDVKERKTNKYKLKKKLKIWKQKIYLALAKQYAINKNFSNAIYYYDVLVDTIKKQISNEPGKNKIENDKLLINIYEDKSKIEQYKENFDNAVDCIKEAIKIAEQSGVTDLIIDCKLSLAIIFSKLDDMNSSSKAEDLFKEMLESTKLKEHLNEKDLKIKDEFVKFYLKQEKYEDACNLLNALVKEKIKFFGDFSIKINSSYKLLCSVYLKKNDMSNAAKHLQKSLDLEELNYGAKDKRTEETKKTLENLKKNPNVKVSSKETNKPLFNAVRKIDHRKEDLKLYSAKLDASDDNNKTLDESSIKPLAKKMNPIS